MRKRLLDGVTVVERHDEVEQSVVRLADFVNRADVRMFECGDGPGLEAKPLSGYGVAQEVRLQELERHATVELGVMTAIDDPHATAAHPALHPIAPDVASFQRRRAKSCGEGGDLVGQSIHQS